MKARKTRAEIRALAAKVLGKHAGNVEVARHVAALLGSIGDTLSNDAIFAELPGIRADGTTFIEVFASNEKPAP